MTNENKLIYDFSEHGVYYEKQIIYYAKMVVLTIDTLQLEFYYETGKLRAVHGFLPLVFACRKTLKPPQFTDMEFILQTEGIEYIRGVAYDYFDFFPKSKGYFIKNKLPIVFYDEKNKYILIGNQNISKAEHIRINKNIICTIDKEGNLAALLLLLDEILI